MHLLAVSTIWRFNFEKNALLMISGLCHANKVAAAIFYSLKDVSVAEFGGRVRKE